MKQLSYKNNWEYDLYFIGDKHIATLNSVSINDIIETVFGIDIEFDLNKFVSKVKIYPIDFTLEEK